MEVSDEGQGAGSKTPDLFDAQLSSFSDWAALAPPPTPPMPARPPTHPRRDLSDAVNKAFLKKRWKRMRSDLRKIRPMTVMLHYDALEWLPFQLDVDARLDRLSSEVIQGTYVAGRPEIVRAAKSLGLTRPLAFLDVRDALLYRNIVALAENDLLSEMQTYTRFGRADGQGSDGRFDPDSGWFRSWLRRNAQLWALTESHSWIVETDISNFFPSIHLDSVLDHLLAHSSIGVDVVRLLSHMLRQFAPVPEYRVSPLIGLPQEPFDCSRIIAHSFLSAVDDAFLVEGTHHRFSRYMDDIAIGATSREEGLEFVSRAQLTLEKLGLYPNASKTRVTPTEQFTDDYMKDENDYLGTLDQTLSDGGLINKGEFEERLQTLLDMEVAGRPKAWERVLRRYATLSRQLRSELLLGSCFGFMSTHPGSTRNMLDYAATFAVTPERVEQLATQVATAGSMYEDVRILAMEFLSVAPNDDSQLLRKSITAWAMAIVEQDRTVVTARLVSVCAILVAKFGGNAEHDRLGHILIQGKGEPDPIRRQLLTIALATGRCEPDQLLGFAPESPNLAEAAQFLVALSAGNTPVVQSVLAVARPRERQAPRIWMIPPRAMFLAAAATRVLGDQPTKKVAQFANLLRQNDLDLRDYAGQRWLNLDVPPPSNA